MMYFIDALGIPCKHTCFLLVKNRVNTVILLILYSVKEKKIVFVDEKLSICQNCLAEVLFHSCFYTLPIITNV